ncbi:MAG: hypothetical protein Q8K87_10810 [Hydrogenophaga sp.]|nr:hypothetical protein [Hydrogenophaga sp.]MDZ4238205.1 hypothetical protein [Hydrogenophaga sp.]
MNFNRSALIRFYDDPRDPDFAGADQGSHVSAITGMIGEDLLLGLMFHCLSHQDPSLTCEVLPDTCKAPGKKGKRLDAWVEIGTNRIAQVEIKNWSAHSLGESDLPLKATPQELAQAAEKRWKRFFGENNEKMPENTEKILIDMPVPQGAKPRTVERWLCFWLPIAKTGINPLTVATFMDGMDGMDGMDKKEKKVHVFSASLYLRQLQLKDEVLELRTPRIDARVQLLNALRAANDAP